MSALYGSTLTGRTEAPRQLTLTAAAETAQQLLPAWDESVFTTRRCRHTSTGETKENMNDGVDFDRLQATYQRNRVDF